MDSDGDMTQAGWTPVYWKAPGGYGSQGNGRGRENAKREVIWFSPFCLQPQLTLFDFAVNGAAQAAGSAP